jgi:hypothetical protein
VKSVTKAVCHPGQYASSARDGGARVLPPPA